MLFFMLKETFLLKNNHSLSENRKLATEQKIQFLLQRVKWGRNGFWRLKYV